MKAQHNFIQNLQRANLSLKQKVKQADEISNLQSNANEPIFTNLSPHEDGR